MKKIICIVLSLIMCFGIVGCGEEDVSTKEKEITEENGLNKSVENIIDKVFFNGETLVGKSQKYCEGEFDKHNVQYKSSIVDTIPNTNIKTSVNYCTNENNELKKGVYCQRLYVCSGERYDDSVVIMEGINIYPSSGCNFELYNLIEENFIREFGECTTKEEKWKNDFYKNSPEKLDIAFENGDVYIYCNWLYKDKIIGLLGEKVDKRGIIIAVEDIDIQKAFG